MRSLYGWIVDHPRICLSLTAAVVAFCSAGLPRLKLEASLDDLHREDDPGVAYFQDLRANFGSETYLTAILRFADVFQPEVVELARKLEREFDGIEGVKGVAGFDRIRALFGEAAPEPLVNALLVNSNRTAIAVHLILDERANVVEEAAALAEMRRRLAAAVAGSAVPDIEYYVIGVPAIVDELTVHMEQDLVILGPLGALLIFGILFGFFRSLFAALLPLLTGVLSVASTLGLMGWLGIDINMLSSTIVLLILVIGCTEDIHFLAEYASERQRGKSRDDALRTLGGPVVNALFLTSATSALGFLSIAMVPVGGLREFALACTVGISLNFVITILVVPSVLRYAGTGRLERTRPSGRGFPFFAAKLAGLAIDHPRKVTGAAAAVVLIFVAGIFQARIDTDYIRFLSKESEIASAYRKFDQDFGGIRFYLVVVETHRKNGVYAPETLAALEKLDRFLDGMMESAVGLVDFLEPAGTDATASPERRRDAVAARLNVVLKSAGIPPFVDHDGSRTVIRVRSNAAGSVDMRRDELAILEFARKEIPDSLEVRVAGEEILITHFSDSMTSQLIENILILAGISVILLSLFFRSIATGFLSLVPNLIPLLAVFGVMGWAGIPLGTGTFSVAIIALGIAVDDSIHLISRFIAERHLGKDYQTALRATLGAEIKPVFTTSLAMTLGFLVMVLSHLTLHWESGWLFATAIVTAFLADVLVTPVFLRFVTVRLS